MNELLNQAQKTRQHLTAYKSGIDFMKDTDMFDLLEEKKISLKPIENKYSASLN